MSKVMRIRQIETRYMDCYVEVPDDWTSDDLLAHESKDPIMGEHYSEVKNSVDWSLEGVSEEPDMSTFECDISVGIERVRTFHDFEFEFEE